MPPLMDRPVIEEVEYSSFDWETHPIDMVTGRQGWGPFSGPWTPFDWPDVADDISYSYEDGGVEHTSNAWQFAPNYQIITLFGDDSLDSDWSTSYDAVVEQEYAQEQIGYGSTIANVVSQPKSRSASAIANLRTKLMGG